MTADICDEIIRSCSICSRKYGTRESLLNLFECYVRSPASSCLNHGDRFSTILLAWLKKNQNKKQNQKIDDSAVLAICQFGTFKIFFRNANSLVSDDNAQEWLVGFILALDCVYSRVMNMWFCTYLMGHHVFPGPFQHMVPTILHDTLCTERGT